MRSIFRTCLGIGLLACSLAGCGGGAGGVKVVAAHGIVTFKGSPVADATVILTPEKGPVAMGMTNAEGKFTLTTGASKGAAIGKAKVAVSVPNAADSGSAPMDMAAKPKNAQEGANMMANMAKAQYEKTQATKDTKKAKSLIPEKYGSPELSGLTATIYEDASKNNIELKLE